MRKCRVDEQTQKAVLDNIGTMGFSKCLKGIRPKTLDGKIVSDADMCDGMGASGIIRTIMYNEIIFDKNEFPRIENLQANYQTQKSNAINHFFEKLLKLHDLMMTQSGKAESEKRQKIMIDFLQNFFEEENADKKWFELLKPYLDKK